MKNFKSWQDSKRVELAPLTGFFGTNSSGKSSLLQMLLLLKQTAEHPNFTEIIFFGDENSLVNLGNFREVIHGHDLETTLELEFGWKIGTPLSIEAYLEDHLGAREQVSFTTDNFTFNASILCKNDRLVVENEPYRVKFENKEQVVSDGSYSNKIYGEAFGFEATLENSPIPLISSEFKKLFDSVYYLGPNRVYPQREYHWSDKDPRDVGLWGDKVIDALLCAHMRRVKISKKGEAVTIEDRISDWLREMNLAYSFSLEPIGALKDDNYEVRIQKSATSPAVTLTDIGYGLSDLLPMLVLCYYTPEGSILILEQPGIHLHPMAQAQLADLFLEVIAERNLQILVESHSEHLLNRLQRRVAEEKIAADQTALYFCRHIDGASKIDKLDMDEFGNITNWPESFFGDEMGDLFAMTEAQRERQKRETELIEGTTIAPSK